MDRSGEARLPNACPVCGADQPLDAARCSVCGARMSPQDPPSAQIGREEILNYSLSVIGLVLIAMGIPCLIGLLCFLLGR
jgi:predicted amidophosphoribosyltransferase